MWHREHTHAHALGEFEWSLGVGGFESCKQSSHRVCHVDHCFGKVLGLAAGATQLHKLWRPRQQKHQSLKHRLDHSHTLENNSSGSSFINVLSGLSQCSCNHGNPLGKIFTFFSLEFIFLVLEEYWFQFYVLN